MVLRLAVLAVLLLAASAGYAITRIVILRRVIPAILVIPDEASSNVLILEDDRGKCYTYDARDSPCDS